MGKTMGGILSDKLRRIIWCVAHGHPVRPTPEFTLYQCWHRRRSLRNLVRYGLLYWPDPACEPALTARSRAWLRANPPWRTRRRS